MFETVAESEMMTKKWQYKPSFKNGQARGIDTGAGRINESD